MMLGGASVAVYANVAMWSLARLRAVWALGSLGWLRGRLVAACFHGAAQAPAKVNG